MHKYQHRITDVKIPDDLAKAWAKWFEEVDHLKLMTNHQPESEYQQFLLNK
jgi:hypothetical protein